MNLPRYNKEPTTFQQQLTLLKSRGLAVDSESKALHLLENLGYYRLSGYWYPLLQEPKTAHKFKPASNFQTAFQLYRFDRDLRIFILKELEKLEITVRAKLTYHYSHLYGCFWIENSDLFNDPSQHANTMRNLTRDVGKSDEEFILSYRRKYSNPMPPSWMVLEVASLGTLSKIYSNLKPGRSRRSIAKHFGLDDRTFSSWLHCLTYIRNVCAHHTRLWNRGM